MELFQLDEACVSNIQDLVKNVKFEAEEYTDPETGCYQCTGTCGYGPY